MPESMPLKKLLAFFDSGMLQLFDFELLLFDLAMPRSGQARSSMSLKKLLDFFD
jgi:hypothetical protein